MAETYQQLEQRARRSTNRPARAEHILRHWQRAIDDAPTPWYGSPRVKAADQATSEHFAEFGTPPASS